ncbi:hypothetical protein [Kribbella sp. CA-247076]
MQLPTVLVLVALAMAVLGIVTVFRERLILASLLIVGGLALGIVSGSALE